MEFRLVANQLINGKSVIGYSNQNLKRISQCSQQIWIVKYTFSVNFEPELIIFGATKRNKRVMKGVLCFFRVSEI